MSNVYKITIPFNFEDSGLDELYKSLKDLSKNEISFYDDRWVCDKLAKNIDVDTAERYTIYYSGVPELYKDWIRYYALSMYKNGNSIRTMSRNVTDIKEFFAFLEKHYNSIPLENVDITHISKYKEYLKKSHMQEDTKHGKWSSVSNFYIKMKGCNGYFNTNIVDKNPFKKKRNDSSKYIPDYITRQLDTVFKSEAVPLPMKAAYWIIRFIPSRIEEIYKIPIDCIKEIKDGWTLTLHMYKQNGGYYSPELRVIRFKNESVEGNFLHEILKQQQAVAESLQDSLPKELKGYFFTYRGFRSNKSDDNTIKVFFNKTIIVASENSITDYFKRVCKKFNICDEEGNLAHFSSHKLRHTGITDRLSPDGGFDAGDVASITHHKNNSMIFKNYNHPTEEQILKSQENVLKVIENKDELDKPIYFQGKIMNITPMLEKRLLRDFRKHKMKLGICSDSEVCKHQYRCLEDCEFYIPDCNDLPYFEMEVESWKKKVEYYKAQNEPISLENAEYNLKIHIKVRDRILETIRRKEE